MSEVRKLEKGVPAAWWDKRIVRRVRADCDPSDHEESVYIALCEIASNRGMDENFKATLKEIGGIAGIANRSTLGKAIERLESLRAIRVERSGELRMASSFTMLRFQEDEP